MTAFDDFVNKAKNVAGAAGKKTSDFVEVTKLKMSVSDLERELSCTMEGLGRLVFDASKTGEDVSVQVEEAVAKADTIKKAIEDLKDKVCEYKKGIRCAACGASNDDDSEFCKKCGTKLR